MTDPVYIHITDQAAAKVLELIHEDNKPYQPKLRAYVEGGGCSGFQYGFTFDKEARIDDIVIEKSISAGSMQLLVDPMSYQYLIGAEIDYKEDIEGSQFIIRNPNAKTTCGCGSSFAIE